MSKTVRYRFTAECPYLNDTHSIYIDYIEVLMSCNPQPGYKKSTYSCNLVEECPYSHNDSYGRCPVYLKAPSRPI